MKDLQIKKLIDAEKKRQKSVINLIASENYCSADSLEALGSVFDNKYAEGYPGARYYGGNQVVDQLELLAQERAIKLFGLDKGEHVEKFSDKNPHKSKWHVNVQPWSGANANLAVYLGLAPIGSKIMGMALTSGGHLSHAQKVSITGKVWEPVTYIVDPETEVLDYDYVEELAKSEKPAIIVAGFTAYPREVDWKRFRKIADEAGALLMVDMSHLAGLIAGKAYPSPFPYADVVTTTTHKTLRGPRGAMIFSRIDSRELYKKIDKAVFPGLQGGPHESQIAGIAVALKEATDAKFKSYAKQVIKNAKVLASELQKRGWHVVADGTDSHMVLVDTWMNGEKVSEIAARSIKHGEMALGAGGIPGKVAELELEKAGIICNKNTVPGEKRSPFDPSGIRLGTPAETTRGKKEADFKKIAEKIDKVLKGIKI
ncbi:MAG: serine hydroxymethyltransferase [Candidatus Pacebacteria bacterium]|nr:serine hydroxymethyltransferase [Candidatus Paceibacterota bacterium]